MSENENHDYLTFFIEIHLLYNCMLSPDQDTINNLVKICFIGNVYCEQTDGCLSSLVVEHLRSKQYIMGLSPT